MQFYGSYIRNRFTKRKKSRSWINIHLWNWSFNITKLLKEAEVNPDTRVKDLTEEQVQAIRKAIDANHLLLEGDLRREVALNIKRLTEIGCYRGLRHRRGLPVRGQRTKTNARTRKGPRKLVSKKK